MYYFLGRRQSDDIFLIFPRKQDLTSHANCPHWKQSGISCLLGKIRKIFQNVICWNFIPQIYKYNHFQMRTLTTQWVNGKQSQENNANSVCVKVRCTVPSYFLPLRFYSVWLHAFSCFWDTNVRRRTTIKQLIKGLRYTLFTFRHFLQGKQLLWLPVCFLSGVSCTQDKVWRIG